jgi:hypothetical protein
MVAPKGGHLQSWTRSRDLKMLFYKIQLGYFFFVWNFNKSSIQSLSIGFTYPSLSLVTSDFHRLDSFFMMFFRLDAKHSL